jgi:hypothetical protein
MEKTKLVGSDRAEGSMPCNTIVSSTNFYLAKVNVFFFCWARSQSSTKLCMKHIFWTPPPLPTQILVFCSPISICFSIENEIQSLGPV